MKTFVKTAVSVALAVAMLGAAAGASAAETIQVKKAKGEGKTKIEAGFFQNDEVLVWGADIGENPDWATVALYVNADNQPTGRGQVCEGSDYNLVVKPETKTFNVTVYDDTPLGSRGAKYKKPLRLDASSSAVFRQGDMIYFVIARDKLADPAVVTPHPFRILVGPKEGGKSLGRNFVTDADGEPMSPALQFPGFKK